MKRLVLLPLIVGAFLLGMMPAFAHPSSDGPNGTPATDCHGHNEVPCRPDPQPTHGKDCTHSDDHVCVTTTTTTTTRPPVTTTTTQPPITTTTTTVHPPTTTTTEPPHVINPGPPSAPVPDPGLSVSVPVLPGEACLDAAGFRYTADPISGCLGSPDPAVSVAGEGIPGPAGELPRTGFPADVTAVFGVLAVALGQTLRGIGRRS